MLRALGIFLAGCFLAASLSVASQAATFSVNSAGDRPDQNPGDGLCFTGFFPIGLGDRECTFRAAIMEANAGLSSDRITFSLSPPPLALPFVVIEPQSAYPGITAPVHIDATTAPGFDTNSAFAIPVVEIDGSGAGVGSAGLTFLSGSEYSIVEGLAIYSFRADGILVSGPAAGPETLVIRRNFIGLARGGSLRNNFRNGVRVTGGSVQITIGAVPNLVLGFDPIHGNVITGNLLDGIRLEDSLGTTISGNRIGTNRQGDAHAAVLGGEIGNGGWGIRVFDAISARIGSAFEMIDGTHSELGNVISGNAAGGILGEPLAAHMRIDSNRIGTNDAATSAVANGGPGIRTSGTHTVIGYAFHPTIGRNVVSGNATAGVEVVDAHRPLILSNAIGVSGDLRAPIPNGTSGIDIDYGEQILIYDNTIGANGANGIVIREGSAAGSLFGNFIGTNASGADLGNAQAGISMSGTRMTIGSPTEGGNVIGFNGTQGIHLTFPSAWIFIKANYIGTDAFGNDLGNGSDGIQLDGVVHEIGGRDPGDGNIIGFNRNGLHAEFAPYGNLIMGNYIGTNPAGDNLGNDRNGIDLNNASDNAIGSRVDTPLGEIAGRGNVIAHNGLRGIEIDWETAARNAIRANRIYQNGQLGIDLGAPGTLPNDEGDFDAGANALQNHPEWGASGVGLEPTNGNLYAQVSVPSALSASAYPLTIDFYLADANGQEPAVHLGSSLYHAFEAESEEWKVFLPTEGVVAGDRVIAVATTADNNTSEASAPIAVPEPAYTWSLAAGLGALGVWAQRRGNVR